jgi:thymidylate synthase
MGMTEGRGSLSKSIKELRMHWLETKSQWRDANAQTFENRFLAQWEMDAKAALNGMDQMAHVLQRIKSDCGDK